MQNLKNKIPVLIALISLLAVQVAKGEDNKDLINKADSLFEQKRYTQSLEIYNKLYEGQEVYTPQMLLKMAYVHEGLKDFSKALYFLNTYYLKTSDEEVLDKMESLAEKHELNGYTFTETDIILGYYNKYQAEITLATMAIGIVLFAFLIYQKKQNQSVTFPAISLLMVLFLLTYMVNSGEKQQMGIINANTAYLMAEPSAGSGVVDIVAEGHRVSILGKKDVWIKVLWEGSPAFIRKNQLMVVGD